MKTTRILLTILLFLTLLVGCGPKGVAQPEPDHEEHSDHADEEGGADKDHADHAESEEEEHAAHGDEETHAEGEPDEHGEEQGGHEGHGDEEEGEAGVFQPGKGIAVNDDTRAAFGLEIGDVTAEPVEATTSLTAQVYREASEGSGSFGGERSGQAYATATLTPDLANELTEGEEVAFRTGDPAGSSVNGKVWKIDDTQVPVTGMAEVLVEIPDADGRFPIGTFLTGEAALKTEDLGAARIPRSAVLDTAAGPFAYVRDGDFLKRTPITIGASNDEFVEVTEGLYEGDEIAITAVQALYITELRATKGGGHSH